MIREGVSGQAFPAGSGFAALRRPGLASTPATGEVPFAKGPALLAAFFVTLLIPGTFAVGGFSLSPYRVVLLLAFVPLFLHWIRGRAGPVSAGDIGILLYCVWIWVALFANHGLDRVHSAGIQFAEMFGGYLIGRTLIRNGADFRRFVRYFFLALLFLLPFSLIELTSGFSPLRFVFERVLAVEDRQGNMMPRLGFRDRVQGPFPHSILFGLFCSLAVANLFYHYRGTFVRRFGALGIAMVLTVISLSSAPLISAALQMAMIAWDRVLVLLKSRWIILGGGMALLLGGFQVLYPGGLIAFIIENLIFIPLTGYARIEIFDFGIMSVYNNPLFGVGYNDWARAFWMGHPTIDNFWLLVAVSYGVPSLLFLWGGIGLNILRSVTNKTLDEAEAAQRAGYLMALVGLMIVLGTVALWGAVSTFVLTYIGAGAWFAHRQVNRGPQDEAEAARPSRGTREGRPFPQRPAPNAGGNRVPPAAEGRYPAPQSPRRITPQEKMIQARERRGR
jgi:hypothetical protein